MVWFALGVVLIGLLAAGVWMAPRFSRLFGRTAKVEADMPCAFGCRMAWIAVKTRDTARLVNVLGLRELKSVSWSVGVGTVYSDHGGLGRVFVTPPVDGWSFVVGLGLPLPMGEAYADKATVLIKRLSDAFGLATFFVSFPALDFYSWTIARNGDVRRAFATGREGVMWNRGAVLIEERLLAPDFFVLSEVGAAPEHVGQQVWDQQDWGQQKGWYGAKPRKAEHPFSERDVMEMARLLSVDPTRLDQRTDLDCGIGYLAPVPREWQAELAVKVAA